jgi:hypothetical protein
MATLVNHKMNIIVTSIRRGISIKALLLFCCTILFNNSFAHNVLKPKSFVFETSLTWLKAIRQMEAGSQKDLNDLFATGSSNKTTSILNIAPISFGAPINIRDITGITLESNQVVVTSQRATRKRVDKE